MSVDYLLLVNGVDNLRLVNGIDNLLLIGSDPEDPSGTKLLLFSNAQLKAWTFENKEFLSAWTFTDKEFL